MDLVEELLENINNGLEDTIESLGLGMGSPWIFC